MVYHDTNSSVITPFNTVIGVMALLEHGLRCHMTLEITHLGCNRGVSTPIQHLFWCYRENITPVRCTECAMSSLKHRLRCHTTLEKHTWDVPNRSVDPFNTPFAGVKERTKHPLGVGIESVMSSLKHRWRCQWHLKEHNDRYHITSHHNVGIEVLWNVSVS